MAEPIMLDLVEYEPMSMYADPPVKVKAQQLYLGVGDERRDGITCLAIRSPGATRRHNIEVSFVRAITIDGVRHVLKTPPGRWKIRAQEIVRLIEGGFSEPWAAAYFDPASPKYWRLEERPTDDPAEHIDEGPRRRFPLSGCLLAIVVGVVGAIAALYLFGS